MSIEDRARILLTVAYCLSETSPKNFPEDFHFEELKLTETDIEEIKRTIDCTQLDSELELGGKAADYCFYAREVRNYKNSNPRATPNEIRDQLQRQQQTFDLNNAYQTAVIDWLNVKSKEKTLRERINEFFKNFWIKINPRKNFSSIFFCVVIIILLGWVVNKGIDIVYSQKISSGQKALISSNRNPEFITCTDKFKTSNFEEAQKCFEKVLIPTEKKPEAKNNPEALIYKNNAIAMQHEHISVVASVPISRNPNNALGILRGISMVQDETNKEINPQKYLLVKIADDGNDPNTVNRLADQFINDPDILVVIGHLVGRQES